MEFDDLFLNLKILNYKLLFSKENEWNNIKNIENNLLSNLYDTNDNLDSKINIVLNKIKLIDITNRCIFYINIFLEKLTSNKEVFQKNNLKIYKSSLDKYGLFYYLQFWIYINNFLNNEDIEKLRIKISIFLINKDLTSITLDKSTDIKIVMDNEFLIYKKNIYIYLLHKRYNIDANKTKLIFPIYNKKEWDLITKKFNLILILKEIDNFSKEPEKLDLNLLPKTIENLEQLDKLDYNKENIKEFINLLIQNDC